MAKIQILPDHVANQIAAGEVIERPAAVVKELVENSIDAGASRINVEFRNGGKSYLLIEDDGHGMTRDDALLSLERHATSKIKDINDVMAIMSFGFRGEALPSIASVSRFTLRTKTKNDACGSETFVNAGKIVHQREYGMPTGTRIEVSHLFNSVPARRKFMKTDNTEAAHIIHLVRLYALAHPKIAFTLKENDRVLFKSPRHSNMKDRIADIWNKKLSQELIPVDVDESGLRLHGYVGKPGICRATRGELITLVNNRPVDSRTLSYAIIESFHTYIPKGKYPVAFLFLEINPKSVDVNVHPAKREIRFREEALVRQFAIQSLLKSLKEHTTNSLQAVRFPLENPESSPVFQKNSLPEPITRPTPAIRPVKQTLASSEPISKNTTITPESPVIHSSRATVTPSPQKPLERQKDTERATPVSIAYSPKPDNSLDTAFIQELTPSKKRDWRYMGTLKDNRALFETPSGLLILNYKSAHERIWFERLQSTLSSQKTASQQLLIPQPIHFDALTGPIIEESLAFFNEIGFKLELFGRNFYRIEAIPDWLEPNAAEVFLRDLVALIKEKGLVPSKKGAFYEELSRMATAKAIRFDNKPSEQALISLIDELMRCENPLACPKGKPTFIELSHGDLDKRFQKGM